MQGREKDIAIFSAVRSDKAGKIGFVADERRINVGLTRARCSMIVVGNEMALREDPVWTSLLRHSRLERCLSAFLIIDLWIKASSRIIKRSMPPTRCQVTKVLLPGCGYDKMSISFFPCRLTIRVALSKSKPLKFPIGACECVSDMLIPP